MLACRLCGDEARYLCMTHEHAGENTDLFMVPLCVGHAEEAGRVVGQWYQEQRSKTLGLSRKGQDVG